jgi:hypothetical protein
VDNHRAYCGYLAVLYSMTEVRRERGAGAEMGSTLDLSQEGVCGMKTS